MILKDILELKNSIEVYRNKMHKMAKEKGVSHPEVIITSQELDIYVVKLQNIVFQLNRNHITS